MKNLLECNGMRFHAIIDGSPTYGKIRVEEDEAFLCQDEKDGDDCDDKLGYNFSWGVGSGSDGDLIGNAVRALTAIAEDDRTPWQFWKEGDKITDGKTVWEIGGRAGKVFFPIDSTHGACVPFAGEELTNVGYYLVVENGDDGDDDSSKCNDKK